jgi:hypothetical protein
MIARNNATRLAAADLDGDGFPDIVAARSDAPSLLLFSRPGK